MMHVSVGLSSLNSSARNRVLSLTSKEHAQCYIDTLVEVRSRGVSEIARNDGKSMDCVMAAAAILVQIFFVCGTVL
jgi:hypothetical protein